MTIIQVYSLLQRIDISRVGWWVGKKHQIDFSRGKLSVDASLTSPNCH